MSKQAYIAEVTALRASQRLRGKIAGLPAQNCGARRPRRAVPAKWHSIAAALVLVVGLGVATPAILRAFTTGGDLTTPPPVTTTPTVSGPEGIIAEGIDVSPVILDAAKEYVGEQYDYCVAEFSTPQGAAVYDNWRINALSAVYERKELEEYTIAVYQLDYRVHTTTPEFVPLPGGMEIDEDGWVLLSSPDSTYLVFLLNYSTNHYFGIRINEFNPGSEDFDASLLSGIDSYLAELNKDADPWGITLRTEDVTPTGLTLVIEQSGGAVTGTLQTGRAYTLERYTDEAWTAVETASGEDPVWFSDAQSVPMGDSVRWAIDLSQIYYPLAPGEYRIGKGIMDFRDSGGYDDKVYYAEFTIAQEIQGVPIDKLDYAKLEEQMDAGDWGDLQEYLPVLREGACFLWVAEEGVTGGGSEDVTLEEYYGQRFGPDNPDGKLDLERFTLFGFEGTGKQDLVLCFFNGGGHYLILHREGEKFYGFERGYRSFLALQRDGVYTGSSGADYNSYYRIKFQAGYYEEELLGQRVGERHEIGGQAVSAEYFWTWQQNCMVGDMYWYYPAQPTGKAPPPSTPEERRYHISIQGLPLEEDFSQLPEGLLATLEDTGEIDSPGSGSPFIMKTYRSSSLKVQTLMAPPEMLEEYLAEGAFTQEQYDAALGTEYIYTVQPLDSSYPTGSGLRLGDSTERARELFYNVPDDGRTVMNAVLASIIVTTENGVVTGLLSSSGGRTVAGILY